MTELERAARAQQRAEIAVAAARARVNELALEQLRAGARPVDVARQASWSAAYLRRIARAAGIAPRHTRSA